MASMYDLYPNAQFQSQYYADPVNPQVQQQANPIAVRQVNVNQPLSQNEINSLQSKFNSFDLQVTDDEILRGVCTHKYLNGTSAYTVDPADGHTCRCAICGESFRIYEGDVEEVEKSVNNLIDMLQTTKLLYIDLPQNVVKNYFQIIPLLKKFKDLWSHAISNFDANNRMASNQYVYSTQNGTYQMNGFQVLNSIINGVNPTMQRPLYGYQQAPVAQPVPNQPMYQQPVYQQPTYGYDPNPMAYGMPAAPVQAAPAVGTVPPAPQAAPVAPAQQPVAAPQQEVQQQQVFNV